MAKVSNLRQFRKRKARQEADQTAAENRARFGRTPLETMIDGKQIWMEKIVNWT